MLLNLSFVFAICCFVEITLTNHLPTNSNPQYAVAKNREELIDIIRSLHDQHEHNNVDEPDTDLNDEEKEKKLQNILWLLNKNYKAQKDFEYLHNNRFHSAPRLHFIKNPLVLEEYKNHLKKSRRFSKSNSKKKINSQNNLKTKLRNMRRDAMFRLGSSESYSEDIDKKEESKLKVRNYIPSPSNNPVAKIPKEKEELQVLKKDKLEEYPEIQDTLELHNTKVHKNLRSDYDFRREKSKWDERPENSNSVEEESKKKKTYRNPPSYKKNRFKDENKNWDQFTTKDYPIKYKKKITPKQSEYKIRPSYKKPKNDNMNKEFHSYGRTSIPFVGKRGIYDDK